MSMFNGVIMKLENKKVNSKKLYSIGYCSYIDKYILECAVPGSVWYNMYYEISEKEFLGFDSDSSEMDSLVDTIRKKSYKSERFLFSDLNKDNSKERAELRLIAMGHSQLYIRFFKYLNSLGRERRAVYYFQYLDEVYDWERQDIEDAIYQKFVKENDLGFAELMPKLTKYNGVETLELKQQALISSDKPNFNIAKTLYNVTRDNKHINHMFDIYNRSKDNISRMGYVVGLQNLANVPDVYNKLVNIYINDEDEVNRTTAICGVLWADGYLVEPGIRYIRDGYDEDVLTEINKEKELIKEFKNDKIEERKRIINSYLNGEFTLFHGFYCLIKDYDKDNNRYELIPYSGSYQELQDDTIFTEYHYWRGLAYKKDCNTCRKIYFAASEIDGCPYCENILKRRG